MSETSKIPIKISLPEGKKMRSDFDMFRIDFEKRKDGHENFDDFLTGLVKIHFNNALKHLNVLLESVDIGELNIRLNIGREMGTTLARYHVDQADISSGKYYFTASSRLIGTYLWNYFEDVPVPEEGQYVWEHELIHMMDHINITEVSNNIEMYDGVELLVKYILEYRFEGIADVYYLLKGYSKYRSIKAARTQFLKRMEFLRNRPWDNPKFPRMLLRYTTEYNHYSVGAWMILHVLGTDLFADTATDAAEAVIKIRKRQAIEDKVILKLIGRALEMDNHSFIKGLIKPGPDGRAFVEHDEFEDLAGYVERCIINMTRVWTRPSQLKGNPRIIELFRLMRMKK